MRASKRRDGIGLQLYEVLSREAGGAELEERRSALASELGAYFGETFIKNHGGRWGWVAATGNRLFGLRTDAGLSAFPPRQGAEAPAGARKTTALAVSTLFSCGGRRRRSAGGRSAP